MNNQNLIRELQKIADTLQIAHAHFKAESEMNAALHMAPSVRPAPLAVAIQTAYEDAVRLINSVQDGTV